MRTLKCLPLILIFLFWGCVSVTEVHKPLDPSLFSKGSSVNYEILKIDSGKTSAPRHFLDALFSYLEADLKELDMTGKEDPGFQVKIRVKDYKMRKGFVKKHLGILGGNDGIVSHVTVTNNTSGEVIGEATVETTNIESSTTIDDMARIHAKKIAKYLAGKE